MQPPSDSPQVERLRKIVAESPWLMQALRAVRSLNLSSWCIGAGAIRNLVWDSLHGFEVQSAISDIDVVFFDDGNYSPSYEQQLKRLLDESFPGPEWEVVNQATVHHWYQTHFSQSVPPLRSLEEGIASWPEYATCVGVFLEADDAVQVLAPHGLDDLFNMMVRRNSTCTIEEAYRERLALKRFAERWPLVRILPC